MSKSTVATMISNLATHRTIRVLALLALTLMVLGSSGVAWARSYWIEDFQATLEVQEDGALMVTETIRFRFEGSYNGVYRDIPVDYRDNLSLKYRLRLTVESVADLDGTDLRYETSTSNGRLRIKAWVPRAQDVARTVVLRYRVERALRFFPEHTELYWNVTGTEWPVRIDSASVRVVLPPGMTDPPMVTAFTGGFGAQGADWTSDLMGNEQVLVRTTGPLNFQEGLTIVVGWPVGLVPEPTAMTNLGYVLADNWPLLIPFAVLGLMFVSWRRWGKDPSVDRSVMPIYTAPEDLSPAELGTLIDERVNERDIVATVIDLAVRGYVRIEEETEEGWIWETVTTRFRKLREADDSLRPHEKEVYEGLFEGGEELVELDDLKNKFYKRLGAIRSGLYSGLSDRGYFAGRPDRVRTGWIIISLFVLGIGVTSAIAFENVAGIFAAVLSGIIVFIFAWFMPARTRKGREKWIEIKGFEEFLGRTEGQRLSETQVDMSTFETLLPYALVLGVAEQWAKAFEGLLSEPPSWYAGGNPALYSTVALMNRMDTMSMSLGEAMASSPRSSSSGSSGFSGGGSSGGGFGGGGGGAF